MNPTPPLKDRTIRRVLIVFLFASAVFVLVAIEAVRNINRTVSTSDWVNHTHSVILEAEALRASIYVGNTSLRAFAATSDSHDEAAAREAISNIGEHLEIAKALTRREPEQNEQIIALESLLNRRLEFMQAVLTAHHAGNKAAEQALFAGDAGKDTMQEIQRKIEKLKDDEMTLLTDRDTASFLQAQRMRWVVWTGVLLDVVLLAGAAWLIRDDIASRRRAAAVLASANEQLEIRVKERTSELAAANTKLSSENLERQWSNQALEHQIRYNELIINSISDLVFVLTKTLKISRVNPAVVHLTGLETTALINQPLSLVVKLDASGGPNAPMVDPLTQALKDGRDLRDQPAMAEDKRGRKIPVRFTLFPLRDRDKVVGGVVTLTIVTPGPDAQREIPFRT